MREFIYFSKNARTTGNFKDLMEAGRMDIACHVVIASFFLSNAIRDDVKLHLVFYGPPDPPKHMEMKPRDREIADGIFLSKKDVAGLIKRMLYKYKKGTKNEVWPGFFIEKKSLFDLIEELKKAGKTIYILDKKGKNLRDIKIDKNAVFILGDHEGIGKKELRRIKQYAESISLGNKTYFASHSVVILNHELDTREG